MLAGLFIKGSLIGFSMAIPIGPVGMLCVQHSLRRGLLAGIAAGLGAALADALYGCMAGFGICLVSHTLLYYQMWLQLIGALVLLYIGMRIFKSRAVDLSKNTQEDFSCRKIFLTTFVLTLTNPFTLLCFTAVYAGLGISPVEEGLLSGAMLVGGILLGAAIWWLLLSCGVSFVAKRWGIHSSPFLNRISGALLMGFGSIGCVSAFYQLLF